MKSDHVIDVTKKTTNKIKSMTKKANDAITDMVDINGDGKFDKHDVSVILKTRKIESDLKTLRPIFKEQIIINYPIINIVNEDKKRLASEVCVGSVGYLTKLKQQDLLNVYEKHSDVVGVQFYPNLSTGVYILNPYTNNLYIKQDEYFNYLKKAHINELEHIAQQLGAKYFRVSYTEKTSSLLELKRKASEQIKVSTDGKANMSAEASSESFGSTNTNIAAELEFEGNGVPTKPELIYFTNETDIEKLIFMRTNPKTENMIKSKKYSFNCNTLSGISESLCVDIDAALKMGGVSSSNNFSSKTKKEKSTALEYIINF